MKLPVTLLLSAPLLAQAFGPPLGYNPPPTPKQYLVDPFVLHACLMAIAVCFFFFPGMLLSRYYKQIYTKWFYIHAAFQTIGILMVFSGFISIFVGKENTFDVGFHQVFGLIAFLVFMAEYAFGLIAHFKFDPSRVEPPIFPDKVHWWVGRFVVVWALITVGLGLSVWGATFATWILYIIWAAVAISFFIVLQFKVGQSHEGSSAGGASPYDYQLASDEGDTKKGGFGFAGGVLKSLHDKLPEFLKDKWSSTSSTPSYLFIAFMVLSALLIPIGLVCKLAGL